MSLQVYFDTNLIDEKYYTGLTNNNELFNESFRLGTTPCNTYQLRIAKEGVSTQPSSIVLKDNGVSFADLKIDNVEEQDYEYVYTLTDKMVDLEFKYDASQIFQNGSTTLYAIVMDICTKVGLNLGTTNFRSYDKTINWYDNTRTAREYIGYVAELNGGFARIVNNTLYFVKQNSAFSKTIDIDDCEDFTIGEYHKITRVVYELGTLKYEYGDESGNTLYLNPENVYITEQSEVEAIYNDIKDFEFYSFGTSNCPIDYDVKVGDVITFDDGSNEYPTIAQYDLEYYGGWNGGYNLTINTERQEETRIQGDKDKIRDIKITVDRQNNTISQVVSEVDEQNTKIAQTQQSVNELNSKIQDIADITTQAESIYASLSFTGINQSEPIEVKIHPTTQNISYLYPRSNLYPSDTLYMTNRILRFTNTDTEEVFDYELPDDLLINPNTGTYDEFYLGYDEQICQVTKRCEYNADGSVSDLATEVINSYTYPTIDLTDGDYTVELLGYNNGYLSVRLMAQNIYTTQFATKAEMNSEISQTAQSITNTVSATYETKQNAQTNYSQLTQTANGISSRVSSVEKGKADKNAIVSEINQSSEAVTINANKIGLTANDVLNIISGNAINLTSKNLTIASNNFNVDSSGNMSCSNANITGGNLEVTAGEQDAIIKLIKNTDNTTYVALEPMGFAKFSNGTKIVGFGNVFNLITGKPASSYIYFQSNSDNLYSELGTTSLLFKRGSDIITSVRTDSVRSPSITQTSKEEDKKNFEKYKNNAIEEIKQIDIYKYNLKQETDGDKKHIGFVIGNNFNYSEEVTSKENDGVDLYSFTSLCCKAIQEQQEQIEQLKKDIEILKGGK